LKPSPPWRAATLTVTSRPAALIASHAVARRAAESARAAEDTRADRLRADEEARLASREEQEANQRRLGEQAARRAEIEVMRVFFAVFFHFSVLLWIFLTLFDPPKNEKNSLGSNQVEKRSLRSRRARRSDQDRARGRCGRGEGSSSRICSGRGRVSLKKTKTFFFFFLETRTHL
jgi:hypothetical protein